MSRFSLSFGEARVMVASVLMIAWADRLLSGETPSFGFLAIAGLPALMALVALFSPRRRYQEDETRIWFAAFSTAGSVSGVILYSPNSNLLTLAIAGALLVAFLIVASRLSPSVSNGDAADPSGPATSEPRTKRRAQAQLVAVIVAIALASIAYRLLVWRQLEQTSALFIGIPALLAIAAAFLDTGGSAARTALKATLLALLISGIFWGEGFVCILMAAPIFLSIAVLLGYAIDRSDEFSRRTNAFLWIALVPMVMEGVIPQLSFPREETVVVERIVEASASDVRRNLSRTPEFSSALPLFLRLGFPRPVETSGDGLHLGDVRVILFAGGEGSPGELTLEVAESEPDRVVFRATDDGSHIAHWMTWRESAVSWRELAPGQTEVRWTIRYRRELDPAWYFGPWERYAVELAGEYLIDSVAGRDR